MPKIDLGHMSLFYLQYGEGPDILWIPGGDNRGRDWAPQIGAFRNKFRNTTLDPRGVGETEVREPPPWTIADFARDCAALIERVCTPPVFAVGLSMGSFIVQQLALDYPALLRCAIPMGTAARATGYLREWMVAEVEFRRAGLRLGRAFAITHYGAYMYPPEVLGDDKKWAEVRSFVADSYGERDGEMLSAQWQACIDFDSLGRLAGCQVPMHVIAFSHDLQTPPARGLEVANAAPDGHFHLLEGLGHLSINGHRPDAVNECIDQIIRQYL